MKNKVLNFINKNKILQYGDSVILGVSGGADSICMLYLLKDISSEMNLTLMWCILIITLEENRLRTMLIT